MKTKQDRLSLWFLFLLALLWLAALALLELNKNTLFGWALTTLLFTAYAVIALCTEYRQHALMRLGAFLGLLVLYAVILKGTVGPIKLRAAVSGDNPVVTQPVETEQGQLTGLVTEDGQVEIYAGIPYAKPPVGELRWREPQDPEPWDGIYAADHFAPMAMQPRNSQIYDSLAQIIGYHDYEVSLQDNFRDAVSEDSLYLNIWKPAENTGNLPVLVFIHGGALQTGQPWYADYSGEGLARKGIIVVNMGYRLGIFGFLADEELSAESPNGTTGNYGLLDQIKALEWIQKNIAAFGGDPGNVTIAGESAGSACVSALCVSPLAKGLFRRAIGESSTVTAKQPAHSFRSLDAAMEEGQATKERFGVSSVDELRKLDAETLAAAADRNHHITVDGYVLPLTPYEAYRNGMHNEEALMHGFNAYEGTPFILFSNANQKNYNQKVQSSFGEYADEILALYPVNTNQEAKDRYTDLYSAVTFTYGHYCWTRQAAALGLPVYEYYFSKDNGRLGAWHSGEEVYCYRNIPLNSNLYDESDRKLSELMSTYWVNFIRTGDPNAPGLPLWERSEDGKRLFVFDEQTGMAEDKYLPIYKILDHKYEWNT